MNVRKYVSIMQDISNQLAAVFDYETDPFKKPNLPFLVSNRSQIREEINNSVDKGLGHISEHPQQQSVKDLYVVYTTTPNRRLEALQSMEFDQLPTEEELLQCLDVKQNLIYKIEEIVYRDFKSKLFIDVCQSAVYVFIIEEGQ